MFHFWHLCNSRRKLVAKQLQTLSRKHDLSCSCAPGGNSEKEWEGYFYRTKHQPDEKEDGGRPVLLLLFVKSGFFFSGKHRWCIWFCISVKISKLPRQAPRLLYLKWSGKKTICSGCTTSVSPMTVSRQWYYWAQAWRRRATEKKNTRKSTRGSDGILSLPLRGVTFGTKRPVMWAVLSGTGRLTEAKYSGPPNQPPT